MGLVVLLVVGLYLLISIGVVVWVVSYARRGGRSPVRWGFGAALVMYLIPFWDLLPTIIAKEYQCANNAGFFVYKTVDQWKKQNPGVMETLSITHLPEGHRVILDQSDYSGDGRNRKYRFPDGLTLMAYFDVRNELMYVEYKMPFGESGHQLNERFRHTSKTEGPNLIKLARSEIIVFDSGTNEVVARQIDFKTSTKGNLIGKPGDSWWKFWFHSYDGCYKDHPEKFPNGGIGGYINALRTDCVPQRKKEQKSLAVTNGVVVSCR